MEGQLDVSRKELATSGERVEASKPKDNLKLEGKLQGDISQVYDLEVLHTHVNKLGLYW